MSSVLNQVAKKERFTLPPSASDAIIEAADGNLRKALLVMEAMRMQNPDLNGDVDVAKPDWEVYCAKIAESIMQEQSPQRLLDIRGKIYELLSHCIPPAVVLKVSPRFLVVSQSRALMSLRTLADPRPSPTDSSPASTTRSRPSSCTGPRTT